MSYKTLLPVLFLFALQGCSDSRPDTLSNVETVPPDTTPPVITLQGAASVDHEQGTTYTDAGATAEDQRDGMVAVSTSGSVGAAAGTYTLTYTATDRAGNTASETRTVTVADTTPPTVTVTGQQNVTQPENTPYDDPGATANDLVDGVIPVVTTGTVDTVPGVYTLTYTATDSAGNTASATRTVTVVADGGAGSDDVIVYDDGAVGPLWTGGINAFDEAIGFSECSNDGGAGCPSISWQVVDDDERGDVLEIAHAASGAVAGLFFGVNGTVDASDYADGSVVFDVRVISGDSKITMKLDCVFPCTSGDQDLGNRGVTGWETVEIPFSTLAAGGLDLSRISTGIVIFATDTTSTVFRIDNVRYIGLADGAEPPQPGPGPGPSGATIIPYGAGSVSDTVNPDSYRCVFDFGNFIFNAGVVRPAIDGCNTATGIPIGTPTPLSPQLTGPAAAQPTMAHRWWGSVSFLGEMTIGDPNSAAYITPDPITARISNRGLRAAGIAAGSRTVSDGFLYPVPDPFAEVFDGVAIGNTLFNDLDAYLKDFSDGSVTVEWQEGGAAVMEATFVHGSPYIYIRALQGALVLRTLRADGGEKGTFYNQGNSLGVWTNIAGNYNNFLVTGEGTTTYGNVSGNEISISNATNAVTLTFLPQLGSTPPNAMTSFFESRARNIVASVEIDYAVDRSDNTVTINHAYLDAQGAPVTTIVGLQPLHWKRSSQATSSYSLRSARGTVRFAQTSGFSYTLPSVGVLPALPSIAGSYDAATLTALVNEFIALGEASWNDREDAYFSGKNYGKVAELIAIASANGLDSQATQLREWLKAELADWFTADDNGTLDENQYFVYDDEWNTLLALEESFASHQQLNDHHFHYGYFVRAAAEICRTEPAWCGADQYGPMVELLIRDYAGGRNDALFPYLRHFDPANGFSWASGMVNFARGNNNESTSEAANSYGAMILYGLITGNDDIAERGMYLHASTVAAYWEYWNNLDGFNNVSAAADNFPSGYNRIAVSILWGDGGVFSTFFSPAFAKILGIQTLPVNPLMLHVGLYQNYLFDYVRLGLTESSNGRPSGLIADDWPDIWWSVWALSDPDAVIADYNTVTSYTPEEGETKAHTYHWIYTMAELGRVLTGTGSLSADYPAAMAFNNNGVTTYVVYNFSSQARTVTYSDGQIVNAVPTGFTVVSN